MQSHLIQETASGAEVPASQGNQECVEASCTLYITLQPDGSLKAGTCAHCVIEELGRPERAWDAEGDRELDFDRDTLLTHLAELGVVLTNRLAYVCP